MNKEEAAQFLGVSVRALERYTKQSRISVRYERGRTRPVATYERDDLERLKAELEAPIYRHAKNEVEAVEGQDEGAEETTPNSDSPTLARFVEVGEVTPDTRTAQAAAMMLTRLLTLAQAAPLDTAARRRPETTAQEASAKLLLTLAEAQTLTGLSRATLKAAIDAGELPANQISRAWRVKRADLERWIETL